MTTLVTADLHLSDNPRDAYRFEFLGRLPTLFEQHEVTRMLILGDLTEQKDRHSARLVNAVVDHLKALSQDVNIIILRGNHDYVSAEVPFYRFLNHIQRIRWINEPTRLSLRHLGNCFFIPHMPDPVWWQEAAPIGGDADWCFCHQTFEGADVGHGHTATGVPRTMFASGAHVISGDIHVPQKIGHVTYVGAPYTVDFGDEFEPRVLLMEEQDMCAKDYRSVPCRGPQKRLVKLAGEDPLGALELLDGHPLAAGLPGLSPGDVVKVRIDLPPGAVESRSQIRGAVRRWGEEHGVCVHTVQIVAGTTATRDRKHREVQHRTDQELVEAYVQRCGATSATLKAGLKILGKSEA